jgi:hypothetical protein
MWSVKVPFKEDKMTKSEIIKKLKTPTATGWYMPMSLNVSVVAELLKDEPECTIPSVRRSCLVDISLIRMDRHPMNPSTLSLRLPKRRW